MYENTIIKVIVFVQLVHINNFFFTLFVVSIKCSMTGSQWISTW